MSKNLDITGTCPTARKIANDRNIRATIFAAQITGDHHRRERKQRVAAATKSDTDTDQEASNNQQEES